VSAIGVDILSAFRKVSTKSDQAQRPTSLANAEASAQSFSQDLLELSDAVLDDHVECPQLGSL
jgi:hypothetical protein